MPIWQWVEMKMKNVSFANQSTRFDEGRNGRLIPTHLLIMTIYKKQEHVLGHHRADHDDDHWLQWMAIAVNAKVPFSSSLHNLSLQIVARITLNDIVFTWQGYLNDQRHSDVEKVHF